MAKKTTRKIKALMILKGITGVQLAKDLGVSRTWLSLVINGHHRTRRTREAIAKALGKKVTDLWPD